MNTIPTDKMPNKGYKQTPEHKLHESIARKGIYKDEKHNMWKGDTASYRAKHQWIQRKCGFPKVCEDCKKVKQKGHSMHWANISGKYLRDIKDWKRLCSKCHGAFDAKKRKLKK